MATWCKKPTHWKRLWSRERLRAREEGSDRMRWKDEIIDSVGMSLSKFWEIVKDREAWSAAVHGVTYSQTLLSAWTTTCIYKYMCNYVCVYKYMCLYLGICIYTTLFNILGWRESVPWRQTNPAPNSSFLTSWLTPQFLSDKMAIQCNIWCCVWLFVTVVWGCVWLSSVHGLLQSRIL